MRQLLEYQADRIEALFAHHKVPARVTGGTVTPRWIRYQVVPAMGVRIASITGLAEELAAALDVPQVRVARQGAAIAVEVPRDDPQPVRLMPLLRGLRNVPPVTAVLGIADDGVPILIRLPSPDVAHILVAGTTGSGKTALLRAMVLSLAYFNGARGNGLGSGGALTLRPAACALRPATCDLRLVLIDPKGTAFRDLADLPHLARPVISDPAEAVEALGSLVRLMEMQSRQGYKDTRGEANPLSTYPLSTCILVIDELVDLLLVAGDALERPLTRLVQRGREAGIHVIAATQKPTAAVIGSLVKANFPVRLVGKVTSPEDARVATGWRGTGAERLLGRGDFIVVAEGQVQRFQAAYITPEEVRALFQEKGWDGNGNGRLRANAAPPSTLSPQYGGDKEDAIPLLYSGQAPDRPEIDEIAVLADRLRPWWKAHRGEWGAKTGAVRYLFGDNAPAGGHYWDLTMAAITRLEVELAGGPDSTSTSTPTEDPLDALPGPDLGFWQR
jgi:S-DNA-T family DNA segregation ATPase FtsK/SpoIIIE